MKKTFLLAMTLTLGLSNAVQANPFSQDLQLLIDFGGVSRTDLLHNLRVYDLLLSNVGTLLKQPAPARRTLSIEQISRIEKSIEDQKGWLAYFPQGENSSTAKLSRSLTRVKAAANAPLNSSYDRNLMKEISAAQWILRQTANDLKNGK